MIAYQCNHVGRMPECRNCLHATPHRIGYSDIDNTCTIPTDCGEYVVWCVPVRKEATK